MCSVNRASFRFCGVELRLSGEAEAVVACLQRWYGAFQGEESAGIELRMEAVLGSNADDAGRMSIHFDDGAVWSVPALQPQEMAALLVRRALSQVGSHFLFHAGALAWQDEGVLLVGASGAGKTTLTLALLEKGFAFLSDETGAVERMRGILHSFPRLPCRRDSVTSTSIPPVGKPVALRHLFLLDDDTEQALQQKEVVVLCDRLDAALLDALERFVVLQTVHPITCRGLPAFAYTSATPSSFFPEIERLCLAHGSTLLDVVETPVSPDFSQPVRLRPLSRSQAALAVLGHLQNGYRSRLFRTLYASNPTVLFADVAALLRGVSCYRLRAGIVEETVDRLCVAVG